ncbi:MAG: BCD family MFS transporter [Anaerolineales bacterium]|nr:BCD family MFS transporter [Anaerolineales bacterium]MCB9127106.1 BCD family MFS transporter [Ardenticatenales bacterium]
MNLAKPILWLFGQLARLIAWLTRPAREWLDRHPRLRWWMAVGRLGLIQFGIGLSLAPITGTLNRALIQDLGIPAVAVAGLISLHYFVSPVRAIVGYRSDQKRSVGKWRTPYIVLGVMLSYGGLALAPFALILLGGEGVISFWPAMLICMAIFALYGAGVNIVETVYLALVSDITAPEDRGKVLSALWFMLVLGTVVSAIIIGGLLIDYSHRRLIQVMQGSAMVFVLLTVIALWRQEQLNPDGTIRSTLETVRIRLSLWESVRLLGGQKSLQALFLVIFVATMAFATHDVLLEPYGGQVLGMTPSATMQLTALWGIATIVGVVMAGLLLWKGRSPTLLMAAGCGVGLLGFAVISLASDAALVTPFRMGVGLISIGRGLFIVGSVILVMSLTDVSHAGLFLGVWGIVQAMAQGMGSIGGGLVRDIAEWQSGSVVVGYTLVYGISLSLLLLVLLLLSSRMGRRLRVDQIRMPWSGLEEIPADQLAF